MKQKKEISNLKQNKILMKTTSKRFQKTNAKGKSKDKKEKISRKTIKNTTAQSTDSSFKISNDQLSMFILSNLSTPKLEQIEQLRKYLLNNLEATLFYYMYSIINDYHRLNDCSLLLDSVIPSNYVHLLPLIIYLVGMEYDCKLEHLNIEKKKSNLLTLLDHDYI
jgi:hypothetical protein